jgi:hypothetical protein
MVTQPSPAAQSGTPFAVQPAVELRDGSGNKVNTAGVAITASLATGPAGGALTGTTVAQTAAGGTATFTNLGITGPAGSYTIQFSSPGLAPVTSTAVVVAAAPASQLAITTQPSDSAANGAAFARQPVVQLRDASGNPVAQSGVTVTATIATGGGALGGTTTATTDATGAATFTDLAITGTIGNRTLRLSATGLSAVTSGTITITPGAATQLTITVQPSQLAISGSSFSQQPVVQLRDVSGNLVATPGVPITVAINTGPGTLNGNLIVNTNSSGTAIFSGLSISGSGTHTLVFTSGNLNQVVSVAILVL